MFQAKWLQQLLHISMCILAFAIPFPYIAGSISVILIILLWIPQANFRITFKRLWNNKVLLCWMLFYLLHALSYTYSADKADSIFDLQTKLSFLVLPLVIGAGMNITRKQLENIFLGFVSGITVVAVFCLAQATMDYLRTGNNNVFFYHDLIRGLNANAVYMAWYVISSISILILFDWEKLFKGAGKILWYLILLIHFTFFILLSSKSLILLFFVFMMPVFYFRHFHKYYRPLPRILIVGSMLAIGVSIFLSNNPIRNRYEDILKKGDNSTWIKTGAEKPASFNNFNLRVFLWKIGLKKISDEQLWWTGVGNGDVHHTLNREMHDAGINNMYNPNDRSHLHNVNLHNMYIQTLYMLGIPGLAVFLIIMFAPFAGLRYIREKTVFFLFQLTAVLFMMQESALQTQAGIIFFTFFSQILWNRRMMSYE